MNDHERGFLEFLAEPSERRLQTLLELGEKRRCDVRRLLDHRVRLNPRFVRRLNGDQASSGAIEAALRARGAPLTCYVLAARGALDGQELSLSAALQAVVGSGSGAFVSCIPGQLGFYEYEDARSSYLLER